MLADPQRMDAYERAIRALVRPGDVVLDLGAGTGILAMLAARAGAARVHAVESMPVARLAVELVRQNGLAGQISVHEADALTLPPFEPVDLVVSDCLGCFYLDDGMLPAVAAAGAWLKPGGRFCPARISLWVAPVGGFGFAAIDDWGDRYYGLDFGPARGQALATDYRCDLRPEHLLAVPALFAESLPPNGEAPSGLELSFTLTAGRLRGFCGWFEAELAPGVTLTNAPGTETHWGQHYFPLPEIDVAAGERVALRLDVREPEWRYEADIGGERYRWTSAGEPGRGSEPRERPADARAEIDALNERAAAAYAADRFAEAVAGWEQAAAWLGADVPDLAPPIYENLGLALLAAGRPVAAMRALLRALDGALTSRPQALAFLVRAAFAAGRRADGERYRELYEAAFGKPTTW